MIGTGSMASPSPLPGATVPRSEKRPAPFAPAAAKEAAPVSPQQPKQAPAQAEAEAGKKEPRQAAQTREAKPSTSARKPTPSYIEPPPIPESVRIEEDEENDATIREQQPEDWMHAGAAASGAAQKSSAAPSAAPAVPIVPQVAGRRTVAGVGLPPQHALSATLPFTNVTPGPFAAAQPAAPLPGLLQSAMPQPSTQPTLTATAQPLDPGVPQPSTLPSLAASSSGAPPVSVVSSGQHGPTAPVSQTHVSPPPSSARPSSRASGGSMPPGSRSLPAGIPSLQGYEPTFAMAPEELVPRVSPSARVVRPRSGWESALGRGGSRLSRTVFAGAAACVALASAIVIVLFLRRPTPNATLELDNAAAVQREPAPEAAQPGAQEHDAPAPPGAPAPAAADDAEDPSADPHAGTPEAADSAAAGNTAAPQLDDRQLAQLFALEHYEPWPSCPERPPLGKAKARAKKGAAKEAKEAVRLLKAARAELVKGNNEKAQSLLCRATTRDPSNSQAQQALAELALRFGNGAQAQTSIQRALARKPEDPTLLGIQGDALVLAGDLPGSRRVWLRANPSPGTDEERMRSLAGTYRKLGDRLLGSSSYAAACALFRRSLVLSSCGSSPQPECKGSYAPGIGLAESLRRLQQPRAALAWAERAANAFPKDARVQVLLGDILFDNGQKQEAKNAWAAARKAQPSNALAAQRLAKGKP
jgi:tetratricopeptide (TPR) repeat protein